MKASQLLEKSIIILCLVLVTSSAFAVDYPIYSVGINAGYAKSELFRGVDSRIFLRYSLEAYIPGFQIDVSYGDGYYEALEDSVQMWPYAPGDSITQKLMYKTSVRNRFPAITGAFHIQPFGGSMIFYFGGGVQFHFIGVTRKVKERYWDDIGEKYQEREVSETNLLDQVKFGYHWLGGIRFFLGKFGTFDVEIRQTFLDVTEDDWEDGVGKDRWGNKSWKDLSVNAGLTIFIF